MKGVKAVSEMIFNIHESEADSAEILSGLKEYNLAKIGPANRKGLTISVRTSKGLLVAGLIRYTHWDWLFIGILWVKDGLRGKILGRDWSLRLSSRLLSVAAKPSF